MDEREWLASTDPSAMLLHLMGKEGEPTGTRPSDRKLRLFACACCRAAWDRLTDPRGRRAVEAAEILADGGRLPPGVLRGASEADDERGMYQVPYWAAESALGLSPRDAADNVVTHSGLAPALQAALLRDLVGNPFRPATLCGLSGFVVKQRPVAESAQVVAERTDRDLGRGQQFPGP